MEKKRSNIVFVVIIIILMLVIGGLSYYTFFYKTNTVEKIKNDEVSDKNEVAEEVAVELDVDNAYIKSLYKNVHSNYYNGIDTNVFNYEKRSVSEMSDEEKSSLAANIYSSSVNKIYSGYSIDEEDVKDAFEVLFGIGSYNQMSTIKYGCTVLNYDVNNKRYYTESPDCGGTSSGSFYEKIIKAVRYSDRIEITTAYVFIDAIDNNFYKDINCSTVVGNYTTTAENEKSTFIDNNKDNLQQNTYTFKMDDNGFYYYIGFERTNN